ncbi:MAG: endonuclease domain-containing protein [Candidatus Omnitrophica bacterium]|nr:endonuclease domain-containing protein [Candidatus Omnitrophota bacterium]
MTLKYRKGLKQRARELRKLGTKAEALLWSGLKNKKVLGYKFNRQKPLGNYIVDFYSHELKLVIEIDGISHNEKIGEDKKRQRQIEQLGLTVLRVYDDDVCADPDAAIRFIINWVKEHTSDN